MKPHPYVSDLITLNYLGGLAQIPKAELLNIYIDRQYRRVTFFGSQTLSVHFEDIHAVSWKETKGSCVERSRAGISPTPILQISCTSSGHDMDILLKKKNGIESFFTTLSIAIAIEAPHDFDFKNRPALLLPKLELKRTIAFWAVVIALCIYLIYIY